jgi:KDO2-lipid IV(A) lauroyltransferase
MEEKEERTQTIRWFKRLNKNRNFRRFRHFLGRILLNSIFLIVSITPIKVLHLLTEKFGILGYKLIKPYKKRLLNHIKYAFGNEKDDKELEDICKRVSVNLVKGFFEMLHFVNASHERIRRWIEIEGKENIDKALSKGKGIILLSAHFGNFPLIGARLAADGYRISYIVNHPSDPKTAEIFDGYRSKLGVKTIPSKPRDLCARETLRALRSNEIVCIIADEDKSSKGIYVDFFGHKAATATGPAVFAIRTGASVIPAFIVRSEDNRHKIIIDKEVDLKKTYNRKEGIIENTIIFTKIVEDYIRVYPDHWAWHNRRWKTQPKEDNK